MRYNTEKLKIKLYNKHFNHVFRIIIHNNSCLDLNKKFYSSMTSQSVNSQVIKTIFRWIHRFSRSCTGNREIDRRESLALFEQGFE